MGPMEILVLLLVVVLVVGRGIRCDQRPKAAVDAEARPGPSARESAIYAARERLQKDILPFLGERK